MVSPAPTFLPQLRHVYHFSWSDRGGGEPPLLVPLVILLHPADALVLSPELPRVVEEVLGILRLHGGHILPRMTGGTHGTVLQVPTPPPGGASLVFHGDVTSARFAIDPTESASRYAVLTRCVERPLPSAGTAGAALLHGGMYDGPSVAPFSLTATIQHKRQAAARRRAAAVTSDPGLAPFLPPLPPP